MSEIAGLAEGFLAMLANERGASEHTVRAYAREVRGFCEGWERMLSAPPTSVFPSSESSTRFTSSILGNRGRCSGRFGVLTSSAGFCATFPSFASHLNQLRIAASALAALAFVNPRSYSTPR